MYFSLYRPDNILDHEVLVEVLKVSTLSTSPSNISSRYSGIVSLKGKLSTATVLLNGASKPYHDLLWETRRYKAQKSPESRSDEESISIYKQYYGASDRLAAIRNRSFEHDVDGTQRNDATTSLDEVGRNEFDSLVTNLTTKRDGNLLPYIPSEGQFRMELLDRRFSKEMLGHRRLRFPTTRYNDPDGYSGHPILCDEDWAQVGYWAPDYNSSDSQHSVIFLAISRSTGLVNCLGLEQVDAKQHLYKRIGPGFWHEQAWDEINSELPAVEVNIT
jgi:hypothetical protein